MAKRVIGSWAFFDHLLLQKAKELRFGDADSSHYVAIKSPATIATSYTLTLPVDDGTPNQALTTDGSGVLSWASYLAAALATDSVFVGIAGVATAVDTASQGDVAATSGGLNVKNGLPATRIADGSVSNTEFQYLANVSADIQTQLNARTRKFAQDWLLADGTSLVVTHNLNTKDVVVAVYDMDDDAEIEVDSIVRTDVNTVTLMASEAPAVAWRVVVVG